MTPTDDDKRKAPDFISDAADHIDEHGWPSRDRAVTYLAAAFREAWKAGRAQGAAEAMAGKEHCPTCICGRRAPVQSNKFENGPAKKRGAGTVAWHEHLRAWSTYSALYGREQSAERMAERGGFGYNEITDFLGHEPTTWEPR